MSAHKLHQEADQEYSIGEAPKGDTDDTDTISMQAVFNKNTDRFPPGQDAATCNTRGKIMIIGSTGFLGPYIVASLLKRSVHSNIICLNRSGDGERRTTTALRKIMREASTIFPRLEFISADITQPDLGLSSAKALILATQIDHIVFSAWDPHWTKPLPHFETLLKAVLNAIEFCTKDTRSIRITFISSICAVGNWPLVRPDRPTIPEEVVSNRSCAMPHGYGESKLIAEQLLADANKNLGLQVNIVRVGQIGGPSSPELGPWPLQGWLYSIIMTSNKLKCFPAKVQPLDWIPVDSLADSVARCASKQLDHAQALVFNVVHPHPLAWELLYNTLQRRFGLSARLISLPEWLGHVPSGKLKLFGFLEALNGGREHNMSFENARARQILGTVQPITEDVLSRWLEGWGLGRSFCKVRL